MPGFARDREETERKLYRLQFAKMGTGRFKKRMSFVEFNHKHPDRLALAELGASSGSVEIGSLAFTDLHPELLSSDTLS